MREIYFNNTNIESFSTKMIQEIEYHVARKREIKIPLDKAAMLILDMQNYFLDKTSRAYIPSSEAIIANTNSLISFAEKMNLTIIFTRHINSRENAGMMSKWWSRLIDEQDELSAISDKIIMPKKYQTIEKHQYDAFYLTQLDKLLKEEGVNNLICAGVMTNLCVETTIRSAFVRGYNSCLPVDATAAYNYLYHFSSCLNLSFGFTNICKTTELIDA